MSTQQEKIHELLAQLVAFESITPHDAMCQAFMITYLEKRGYRCERFDSPPVSNFYAEFGTEGPLFIFAGHTDVVPVGDRALWHSNPFQLKREGDLVFGRGVADMKGSLACMLIAAERFAATYTSGRLGLLITSGEEGDEFQHGTPYVMEQLHKRGIHPNYCIVGEPSSSKKLGDVVKIGRRGSLTGLLNIQGKQGHVAYPHLAQNPIHLSLSALNELVHTLWDEGNTHFPPTSFQITHIQAGGEANNIIPGILRVHFNFRYSTEQTAEALKTAVNACFQQYSLTPEIEWIHNGEPFLTSTGRLLEVSKDVIQEVTGQVPELSTSGGTSDGRFIAPSGVEVIELGPINATIHQVNECCSLSDLDQLTDLYALICNRVCS